MYGTHTVRFNPTVCIHISGLRVLVILKRETWCTLRRTGHLRAYIQASRHRIDYQAWTVG